MALLLSYENNAQNLQHMRTNELFTWLVSFRKYSMCVYALVFVLFYFGRTILRMGKVFIFVGGSNLLCIWHFMSRKLFDLYDQSE